MTERPAASPPRLRSLPSPLAPPLPVLLARRAERDPDGVLIECVDGGGYTNGAFQADVMRFAYGLRQLGVGPGDRVAVMLDATPLAHVCWIGTAWLKACEVPVNTEFRGSSLQHALADSGAVVLVTTNALAERVDALREAFPQLRLVITTDTEPCVIGLPAMTLAEVMSAGELSPEDPPRELDAYAVIYTSGTTGPSKGVVMPWANIHSGAVQMFPGDEDESYPDGACYSPWPTFHAAGKTMLTYAGIRDLRLVMRPRFSVSNFWDDVRKYRCTHVHMLGFAPLLARQPPRPDDADNPMQRMLLMPLPAGYREFEQRFGVRTSTGWGMTEIGFPMAIMDPDVPGTCGVLSPLYEARIVDEDDFELPDGEVGELIIRAHEPWLMLRSYLGRWEATARAWRNGWFHTGDALRRDAAGNYFFVDRIADYLRTRGNNVSSLEVEAEVRTHPGVADCACIGVPSDLEGDDDLKLVIIAAEQATVTAAELYAYLEPRMPKYQLPRYIQFTAELPRTPTGKVRKGELRAAHQASDEIWDRTGPGNQPR
jgi:crotonobetaine/carnitine-CoA ligase